MAGTVGALGDLKDEASKGIQASWGLHNHFGPSSPTWASEAV